MVITRKGSNKDKGRNSVELKSPLVSCATEEKTITFAAKHVRDFSSRSHHDYQVTQTLDEFRHALEKLAAAGVADCTGTISAALAPSILSLLRLTTVCVGPVGASGARLMTR